MNNSGTNNVSYCSNWGLGTVTPTQIFPVVFQGSSIGSQAGTVAGTANTQVINNTEISGFVKINPMIWQYDAGFTYKREQGTITRG